MAPLALVERQINFRASPAQADALELASRHSGRPKSDIIRRGLQREIERVMRAEGVGPEIGPVEAKILDLKPDDPEAPAPDEVARVAAEKGVSLVVARALIQQRRKK